LIYKRGIAKQRKGDNSGAEADIRAAKAMDHQRVEFLAKEGWK